MTPSLKAGVRDVFILLFCFSGFGLSKRLLSKSTNPTAPFICIHLLPTQPIVPECDATTAAMKIFCWLPKKDFPSPKFTAMERLAWLHNSPSHIYVNPRYSALYTAVHPFLLRICNIFSLLTY